MTLNQVASLNNKGLAFLSVGLANYTQAIAYYDIVLAINPKNIAALDNKRLSFYHLGRYLQAIVYYDKSMAIDPRYVFALSDKGNALSS